VSDEEPEGLTAQESKSRRPAWGSGRDALLDATVRLAVEGGLPAITLRAVAEEAGVTHGLVVHHFGTKSGLVHAALMRGPADLEYRELTDQSSEDPATFAAHQCEEIEQAPKQYIFVYEALLEAIRSGDLRDEHRENYEETVRLAAQALENAGAERSIAFARLVVAALDGIALQQLLFENRDRGEATLAELHQVIREAAARDVQSQQ
jgi:AcrR family transcriptional regulator